jgi:capsular polysaccharide biosynthesis protein
MDCFLLFISQFAMTDKVNSGAKTRHFDESQNLLNDEIASQARNDEQIIKQTAKPEKPEQSREVKN